MFNEENENGQNDQLFFETLSDSGNDLTLIEDNNSGSLTSNSNLNPDLELTVERTNEVKEKSSLSLSSTIVNNIDNYIFNFVEKVKFIYYTNDIDKLDQLLKDTFPQFYLLISTNMSYFMSKLKLFKLLWEGKFEEAKDFYLSELFPKVKATKQTKWMIKNKFFLKIIDYPIPFRDNKYLEKYFPQFEDILNKSLRQYLEKDSLSSIERKENIGMPLDSNGQVELVPVSMQMQLATSPQIEGLSQLTVFNSNGDNINEDFSDFEEELGFNIKDNMDEGKETETETLSYSSKSHLTNNTNTNTNGKAKAIANLCFYHHNTNANIFYSNPKPSNCLFTLNKVIKPKKEPSERSLYKILPSLRAFKPNYTKRENIDKKIIRKFRQFIVELIKKKAFNYEDLGNSNFWILLINGELFPPFNYYDEDTNEQIAFKSLNSNYLLWIYSKNGIKTAYDKFLKCQGTVFVNSLIADYNINDNTEKKKIESYVNNLPFIFDISLLPVSYSNSSNDKLMTQLPKNSKYKINQINNKQENKLDRSRGCNNSDEDEIDFHPYSMHTMNKDSED